MLPHIALPNYEGILEDLRLLIISVMYTSAALMAIGESLLPAFLSQVLWLVFSSNILVDYSWSNLRDLGI
jgi:hypothetical protein